MELLGFLFIISVFLNILLFSDKKRLYNDIKWFAEDREKILEKYLNLYNQFYKTNYTEEYGYLSINTELNNDNTENNIQPNFNGNFTHEENIKNDEIEF